MRFITASLRSYFEIAPHNTHNSQFTPPPCIRSTDLVQLSYYHPILFSSIWLEDIHNEVDLLLVSRWSLSNPATSLYDFIFRLVWIWPIQPYSSSHQDFSQIIIDWIKWIQNIHSYHLIGYELNTLDWFHLVFKIRDKFYSQKVQTTYIYVYYKLVTNLYPRQLNRAVVRKASVVVHTRADSLAFQRIGRWHTLDCVKSLDAIVQFTPASRLLVALFSIQHEHIYNISGFIWNCSANFTYLQTQQQQQQQQEK